MVSLAGNLSSGCVCGSRSIYFTGGEAIAAAASTAFPSFCTRSTAAELRTHDSGVFASSSFEVRGVKFANSPQRGGFCTRSTAAELRTHDSGVFASSSFEVRGVKFANSPQRGGLSRRNLPSPVAMALDASNAAASGRQTWPIPQTIEEAIEQASGAIQRALASGKKRQKLQLLLPVDQRQFNYLDTEPRDYPCGIGEEYLACTKMVGKILQAASPLADKIEVRRIGEVNNEMDPVGLVFPADKSIAAVVLPIAESLKQVRSLASKEENRPLLMINPQWRSSGQVVSDFGFGPWRRQAEEFVDSFENTYTLIEQRVGEASNVTSSSGGVVRILKCYPGDWQVHLMSSDGTDDVIGVFPAQPTYKELETAVKEGRTRNPWKAAPRILGGSEPAPPPLPKSLSGALSDAQIDAMDTVEVRRALMALNLPSSGRMFVIKERLKEAQRSS